MGIFKTIKRDLDVVLERDPAARSRLEVLLCYPGFHALLWHRLAHWLYKRGWLVLARLVSQINRTLTQIEIHPGAEIGEGFFIDHGAGVVIGETTVIGNNVTLYQGVTLGGTGKERGKRHPTLGNNVVVSAGAKILGTITIGDNVKIGAGSVVLKDVPPNCTVVGVPGRVVVRNGTRVKPEEEIDLNHHLLPDPISEAMQALQNRITLLEQRLHKLEKEAEHDKSLQYAK
ncbi:MAG: serine O-acetyltransferase [Syntrophomonadaceae bacterium]|jgi:serine O-acetyltransferase|nr:serine O-acetyltransferase [Syntrophomonadaceae bacterium]